MEFSTHFRYPTDEQLPLLDISSSNNLPSVQFSLNCILEGTLVQLLIGNCCYDCSVCLFFISGARARAAEHMSKKIWLSMHPINFGSDKIRPSVRRYVCKYAHPFFLADVKL